MWLDCIPHLAIRKTAGFFKSFEFTIFKRYNTASNEKFKIKSKIF